MSDNSSVSTKNSYSQALFELSVENKNLENVEKEVLAIIELIKENKYFKELIKDPTIKNKELSKAIVAISDKFKFNLILKKFLIFLISKRRLFYLEDILKIFLLICSKKRGEISAKLISSKDLTKDEIDNIKKEFSENFGSSIKLNYKFDPSLIGGLIIQVGSVMIDSSIKNKLNKIENKMIEA